MDEKVYEIFEEDGDNGAITVDALRTMIEKIYLLLFYPKSWIWIRMPLGLRRNREYNWQVRIAKSFDKNAANYIKENIKWKDKYKGERCFILGNGPSLRDLDLNQLADEYVFVVKDFFLMKDWEKAKPNFLVNLAICTNGDGPEMEKWYLDSLTPYIGHELEVLLPFNSLGFITDNHLQEKMNINYILEYGKIKDSSIPIDFTKAMPSFSATVQTAVAWALYMGFSEIYLDGIDSDNILTYFLAKEGKTNKVVGYDHAYEENENHIMPTDGSTVRYHLGDPPGIEADICYGEYEFFNLYRILNDYALAMGSRVYNCSSHSLVTAFPRVKREDILK